MTNDPPFDPYGAKQAVMMAHIGALEDYRKDNTEEVERLRTVLDSTLELIVNLNDQIMNLKAEVLRLSTSR